MINKFVEHNVVMKFIRNNTGYSIKNLLVLAMIVFAFILLAMPVAAIISELYNTGTVTMSWSDIGLYIGSVATLPGMAGFAKVWSEKYERTPGSDGILGTDDDIMISKDDE